MGLYLPLENRLFNRQSIMFLVIQDRTVQMHTRGTAKPLQTSSSSLLELSAAAPFACLCSCGMGIEKLDINIIHIWYLQS